MIHIYGKYYAKAYEHGYILMKDNGRNDKGKTKWLDIGYYGTLERAVEGAYNNFVKDKFTKTAIELKEAIEFMRETREIFRKAFEGLEDEY